MNTSSKLGAILAGVAFGTLAGLTPIPGVPAWAADTGASPSTQARGAAQDQGIVVDALAKAHQALQHREWRRTLDEVERAESSLLNLRQIKQDPTIDQALGALNAARIAVNQKDMRAADEHLAAAAHRLTFASNAPALSDLPPTAAAPPPASTASVGGGSLDQVPASRIIGEVVFDAINQPIGPVVEIVFTPQGQADIVISVAGDADAPVKDIAVPITEVSTSGTGTEQRKLTLDRSRDQIQHAAPYRLPYGKTASNTQGQ